VRIFTAHLQKWLFRSFRPKTWPRHSPRRPRFPFRQMYFHYWVTFTGYIRCFLCYYVVWPCYLDLWPFDLESGSCTMLLTSDPHTNVYYAMTIGYWVTITEYLITFPLSETVTCTVSHDLCIGGPPEPHVTIFWPRIIYSLYNFYGATTTIKGSFILENPRVKAIFSRKKNCPVKIGPKMAVFRKFEGLNIKYSHRGPQKALPFP